MYKNNPFHALFISAIKIYRAQYINNNAKVCFVYTLKQTHASVDQHTEQNGEEHTAIKQEENGGCDTRDEAWVLPTRDQFAIF